MGLHIPLTGPCSLLLATRAGRRLVYVGRVEWGVTRAVVAKLHETISERTPPACDGAEAERGAVWVEPATTVEVTRTKVMQGRLRDPVLRAPAPAIKRPAPAP